MIHLWKAHIDETPGRGLGVAESTPIKPDHGLTLSRWSRLKRAAAEEQVVITAARAESGDALLASKKGFDTIHPDGAVDAVAASVEYDELPPISAISLAEDFTPFMQAKVPQALKRQALKALFKEPHFNVMDGLDIYIDDYTVFEPISPEVMATLSSWKTIMNPPQQVVTSGGYAVDVESEEGKAALAARADLAEANAALQSDPDSLQARSSAARERAEGEGGDTEKQTSHPIDHTALDMTAESSDVTDASALTPILSRAAGEGATPHVRYGKRVGDFSASSYAAAEQAALDAASANPANTDPTANAATKNIT